MSDTSSSYQCTYIKGNENYTSSLICRTSDLIQRFSGSVSSPEIPDEYNFEKQKPVLQILLSSADTAMTEAKLKQNIIDDAVRWYINDSEIVFGNDGLSAKLGDFPAGTFKKIKSNADASYPFGGLQFLKNLVTPLGGISGVVKCVLAFSDLSDNVITKENMYTIGVREFSSDGYELEVYTTGSTVLDATNQSVQLYVRLWKGATKVYDSATNTGKTVRWYKYSGSTGNWVEIATETGKFTVTSGSLKVQPDAVPTYVNIMAGIFSNNTDTDYAKAESTDIITIHDTTDALFIQPNPTPADGVLRAGETTPDGVTLTPKVFSKSTGGEVTGFKFKFICMTPAGTILNGTPSSTPGATGGFDSNKNGAADNTELLSTYKVPRAMFEAIGEGPTVLILGYKQ